MIVNGHHFRRIQRGGLCALLALVFSFLAGRPAVASDAAAAFDSANKLYEQGKFREAAAAYQRMIDGKNGTVAVSYNLANALFKAGDLGRAIWWYRIAELASPRDPDVRANLAFARQSAEAQVPPPSLIQRLSGRVTLNELAVAAVIVSWPFFFLLAAGELRNKWKEELRPWVVSSGIMTVATAGFLTATAWSRFHHSHAIVVAPEAVVRYGPVEESQSHFTLRPGNEVRILDSKNDWLQLSDRSGRAGWVAKKQVLILPAG